MSESDRKIAPLILVGLVVLAFIGTGVVIALNYNPTGLEPGDVYSQGLDVERNEHGVGIRLITVYGQEVIAPPSLLRQPQLGPRQVRIHLAVILPEGALVNGTGVRSSHGQNRSILQETLSWSVRQNPNDLNKTIRRTLTYEYDGRKQVLNIGSQVLPLTDGSAFVVLLDGGWIPTIRRVNQDLDVLSISEEQRNALRDFFVNENKNDPIP